MTYSARLVQSISLARSGSFPLFFCPSSSSYWFPVSSPEKLASTEAYSGSLSLSLPFACARARRSFQLNFFFLSREPQDASSLAPRRAGPVRSASHEDSYRSDGNNAALRWRRTRRLFTGRLIASSRGPLGLPRALLRGLVRRRGKTVSEEKETGEDGHSITPSV